MTIHYGCRKLFEDVARGILVRAEMDQSVFQVIEETGRTWDMVRKAIDPAMSDQNMAVQGLMKELLECECPIYRERRPE